MLYLDISKFPITVFGSVLGTGGLVLASRSFLPWLIEPLTWILLFFFLAFSVIFLIKIALYPGGVKAELQNPLPGNFYALQPISAVILAILCRGLLPGSIDIGLLIYGTIGIFVLSIYLPYHFFSNMNVEFSHLHGGWFITPVATILVTNALLQYPATPSSVIISLLFFGIGSMLFLIILVLLFFRLISHTLPPADLAPTNYIVLAPIGILIVDILQMASVTGPMLGANLLPFAVIGAGILWGFGIWAIGVNLLLLGRYIHLGLRFHIGWWSYVFPTAAFVLGTISLSHYFAPLKGVSLILYACLGTIFLAVLIASVGQLIARLIRKGAPSRV